MKSQMRSTARDMMLLTAMMLLLMLTLTLLVTGCETTQVVAISSDREVKTVHKGQPFTPPEDGKFVPLARWMEIQDVYIRQSFER